MQIATYFDILRRRLLIFLVIPAVLAALAMAYTESKTPIYESQATLLVRNLVPVPDTTVPAAPSELNDLLTNDRIMATYTALADRRVVRQSVIEALGLPYTEAQVAEKVSVEHLRNTQLLTITARDADAELASSLANQAAEVFIAQSDAEFGQAGTVAIVEEAAPGSTPVSPDMQQAVLLAIVLGVLIAGVAVLVLEHADDTLMTPQDVSAVSGLPTLAVIGRARHPDRLRAGDILLEDYRDLRSTVISQREHHGLHAILIAGHGRNEGRTTTALNLSITLAELGESVILVDADLRQPNLHKITGTPNDAGVSDLLQREYNPADWPLYRVNKAFELLPAGPPPSSPAVVSSASMEELLRQLKASADIVILDSPALSAVSDGFDLARVADGAILVVEAGKTRGEELQSIASMLDERGARVLGVVLNKGESPRRKHPRYRAHRNESVAPQKPAQRAAAAPPVPGQVWAAPNGVSNGDSGVAHTGQAAATNGRASAQYPANPRPQRDETKLAPPTINGRTQSHDDIEAGPQLPGLEEPAPSEANGQARSPEAQPAPARRARSRRGGGSQNQN